MIGQCIIAAILCAGPAAQRADSLAEPLVHADSATAVFPVSDTVQDTAKAVSGAVDAGVLADRADSAMQDTVPANFVADFDTLDLDTLGTDGAVHRIKSVHRHFEYRRQVGLALFMMAFVTLMMTSAQTWNPR